MRGALILFAFMASNMAAAAAPSGAPTGAATLKALNETVTAIGRWIESANIRMAALGIDEFAPHFTPAYLAKRRASHSLAAQKRLFRAHIGLAMAESMSAHVRVPLSAHVTAAAAQAVLAELKARGFDVWWVRGGADGGWAEVLLPPALDAEHQEESTIETLQ